jgi:hypothetical protein
LRGGMHEANMSVQVPKGGLHFFAKDQLHVRNLKMLFRYYSLPT